MSEKEKIPLSKLLTIRAAYTRHIGGYFIHKKSGEVYSIEDVVFNEADMVLHFTYFPLSFDGVVFSRPVSEFLGPNAKFEEFEEKE